MKKSFLVLMIPFAMRMAEDAPAAAPATVPVDVPAEHEDLLQRAVALLKKGEQFVVDNIEAGLSALEALFETEKAPADPAPLEDAEAIKAEQTNAASDPSNV
jgi:hypothetical protein